MLDAKSRMATVHMMVLRGHSEEKGKMAMVHMNRVEEAGGEKKGKMGTVHMETVEEADRNAKDRMGMVHMKKNVSKMFV